MSFAPFAPAQSRPENKGMRFIVALLVTVLTWVALPLAADASVVAEKEPNSTTSTSQSVSLGTKVQASFRTSGDCDNGFYDCDVYRLSTTARGRLVIDLRFSDALGTDGSFRLVTLNAVGDVTNSETIASSDYSGSRLRSTAMFVGAGTFYISLKARVSGFGSGYIWSGQPYTISATVTPGVVETEPNDNTATADVITLGQTIAGSTLKGDCNNGSSDCDTFRLSLASAATLAVDFRFPCDLGTSDLYKVTTYNTSGDTLSSKDLAGGDCKGAALRSSVVSATAGNFYVGVSSRYNGPAHGVRYELTVLGVFATTTPVVLGTARVGRRLTVSAAWTPVAKAVSYQWLRDGHSINGAVGPAYALTIKDAGHKVSVRLTGSRPSYITSSRTSASAQISLLSFTIGNPAIRGKAKVGKVLSAVAGHWAPVPVTLKYQWLRSGKKIAGATKSTYKLTKANVGKRISVRVTGSRPGYRSAARVSHTTNKVSR